MEKFNIGDKVRIIDFIGNTKRKGEVTEITKAGNVRVSCWKGLFCPDGTERRMTLFYTDRVRINKL